MPQICSDNRVFGYLCKAYKPPVLTVRINKLNTKVCILFMQCIYLLCFIFTVIFGCFPKRNSPIGFYNTNALCSP